MRAIVYHGPGDKRWEEVSDPKLIDDTDAIVRVDAVTICGTGCCCHASPHAEAAGSAGSASSASAWAVAAGSSAT
jgi:hypothetical protein